jgi:hypothetical protein
VELVVLEGWLFVGIKTGPMVEVEVDPAKLSVVAAGDGEAVCVCSGLGRF